MKSNKQTIVVILMIALVAVLAAACGPTATENAIMATAEPGGQQQPADTSPMAGVVSGTVNKLDRAALTTGTLIEVQLQDISMADAPAVVLATQTIEVAQNQLPLPFELVFDPTRIQPSGIYSVSARVTENGQLRYISDTITPVLTAGAATTGVEIMVVPVYTDVALGLFEGTVNKLDRSALPPDAVIEIELVDVSAGTPTVITMQTVQTNGQQVPIPFQLVYNGDSINQANTYVLNARILAGGQVIYETATGVPVLTNGAPRGNVEIMVVQAAGGTASGDTLRGTVTVPRPSTDAFEPGTMLQVDLREPMLADAPAAATMMMPVEGMTFPITFELTYDATQIAAERPYVVGARILSGNRLLYRTVADIPALTMGAPANDIIVPLAFSPDPAGGVVRFVATSATPMLWPVDSTAYLNVEIREPMLADAPAAAFTYIPLAGLSFPVGFELGYDAAGIDPNKDYILDGRIIDANQLTFQAQELAILTKGAPATDVELVMVAEPGVSGMSSAAALDGFIRGTITTDQPAMLDAAAVWAMDLREAGTTGDPLVTVSAPLNGAQFPLPFELAYDPATIDPNKQYVVGARILLGDRVLYASAEGVAVLTQGAPAADVVVNIPPQ